MKHFSLSVKALADNVFNEYMKSTMDAVQLGTDSLLNAKIKSIGYEASETAAKKAELYKTQAEALLSAGMNHDDEMLLELVIFNLDNIIGDHKFYWNRFDYEPFFNSLLLNSGILYKFPLISKDYLNSYVGLISSFADLAADMLEKAKGQLKRGILMAKPLAKLSAGLFDSFVYKDPETSPLALLPQRIANIDFDSAPYNKLILANIVRLSETCKEMRDFMEEDYYAAAPENIGYAQYEGGKEYYDFCVKKHTTTNLTPKDVFELGNTVRREIEEKMASIRMAAGYNCSREEFTSKMMDDPAWKMDTPEEFGRRLNECVIKISPLMDKYFGIPIKTPCAAVRLSPDMEPYYFNGIYRPANPPITERGEFSFNGMKMEDKNPLKTESLCYHELLPGHHYHFSVIRESKDMHPLVKTTRTTAFSEGWAEYASAFAGEIGLYNSQLSEYGRLESDLYLSHFLIIDTSVNAIGWSIGELEKFIGPYLQDFKGERLTNQLMRASQSLPGFCLAYKIGSLKITDFRHEAEKRLGGLFDIREFHKTVLEWGTPPLYILKKHIDWYIKNKLEESL